MTKRIASLSLCALFAACAAAGALQWTIGTVDSSGHAGQYASLAVGAGGVLHICYYDSLNHDLLYASRSGTAWSFGAIDTAGDVGRHCAIALGADNNPRVSYFDSTNRSLKYGYYSGTAWTVETADPGPGVGHYTSIAMAAGDPIISYYDQSGKDLMYAAKSAAWALTRIDSAGDVGRYSSVAYGSDNKPRISYYSDTLGQLRFVRMLGSNWQPPEVPDTAIFCGAYSRLVLSGTAPTIAYFDSSGGRIRRSVKPSAWVVDTADNSGTAGGHVSLSLDPAGNTVISYFDGVNGDLRLARHVGSAWSLERVDTAGTVGLYTSCRVGSDSTVYVAYYDQTRGRLKLASASLDFTPPVVASVSVAPDTVRTEGYAVLTGRITDNRAVAGAEYFIDAVGAPGTGLSVNPVDSFGSATVDVYDTVLTSSLAIGTHRVYLHGMDASGLWGAFDSASFFKEAPDTAGPTFSIQVAPASPTVGIVLSVSAQPSEPLHPDSAVACTLRASDGSLRPVVLLPDSAGYSAFLPTEGLPSGPCRLTVAGYDRWINRGSSHADFALSVAGEFLPEEMVYVWPNPARGDQVFFHYYVNSNAAVTAEVFSLDGRRVASLSGRGEGGRPPHQANSNAVVWDIRAAASDVYILRLTAVSDAGGERKTVVRKFAIVK